MKNSVWKLFGSLEHYPKAQGNSNTFLYSKLSFNNKLNKETKIHMGHWTMWEWWVELNRCSLILLPSAQCPLWLQTICSKQPTPGLHSNFGVFGILSFWSAQSSLGEGYEYKYFNFQISSIISWKRTKTPHSRRTHGLSVEEAVCSVEF